MERVKTMFPTKANVAIDPETPIPIEAAYFLEDGEQDPTKPNRYYFNFPAEWSTSNRGESIIGVRNISIIPRRRVFDFTIGIRKYPYLDFLELRSYDKIADNRKSELLVQVKSWLPVDKDLREIWSDMRETAQI